MFEVLARVIEQKDIKEIQVSKRNQIIVGFKMVCFYEEEMQRPHNKITRIDIYSWQNCRIQNQYTKINGILNTKKKTH